MSVYFDYVRLGRFRGFAYRSRRAWRRELSSNRHGLAHLALRALRILDDQLAEASRDP